MIGVALIGYGYWGPNLARNIAANAGARLIAIADPDPVRRGQAACDYPAARIVADAVSALDANGVEAAVIAAPPGEHDQLTRAALDRGRHVLVEKPGPRGICALADTAARGGRVLMIDHTFVYAPAVEALAVAIGEIGPALYIDMARTNLARFDAGVGVIRDLAVHDLAILARLLGRRPASVSARGRRPLADGPEELALLALDYADGPIVRIHVDCISPLKIRRVTVGGAGGLAIWDDVEPVEKLRVFRRAPVATADLQALRIGYRGGSVSSPALAPVEPLARMLDHFLDCVRNGTTPITGGAFAADVVAVIEAAERSLAARGAPVAL
jgi:predicted dehydrogenase